jgi:hypothetical protein
MRVYIVYGGYKAVLINTTVLTEALMPFPKDFYGVTSELTAGILGLFSNGYEQVIVTLESDNASDTSVSGTIQLLDLEKNLDVATVNGNPPITAVDIADAILETPANLLATDANGRVDLGAVGGSADAAASLAIAAARLANKSTYTVDEETGVGTEVVRNAGDTADLYTITYTETGGVQTRSAPT